MKMERFIVLLFFQYLCFITKGQVRAERIYLHTDKQCYVTGEIIWLKAYLLRQFAPDYETSNLYIDLLDEKNDIKVSKKLPVFAGTAIGSIDIGSSFVQGIYGLRVYTNPILKAGKAIVKAVYVFNPSLSPALVRPRQNFYNCTFFANNNQLIPGIENAIYFKATGAYNFPVNITGNVIDKKGKPVLTIKDIYKGSGKIILIPAAGDTYTAQINFPDGTAKSYMLPQVKSGGMNISSFKTGNYISFHLIDPVGDYIKSSLTLYGVMGSEISFEHKFKFAGKEYNGKIDVSKLPEGVLYLLVSDGNNIIAQSRTFIDKLHSAISITKKETVNSDNKQVGFSLVFPDSIYGSFSVAVTDAGKEIMADHNNIFTELLFNQESDSQDGMFSEIDFNNDTIELCANTFSKKIALEDFKEDKIFLADSNYISVSGQVMNSKNKKPVTKGNLILFFKNKTAGTSVLNPVISREGKFSIRNLFFFDTATFSYEWSGSPDVKIIIDTNDLIDRKTIASPELVADISVFNKKENVEKAFSLFSQLNLTSDSFKLLPNVTVESDPQGTLKEQVNKKYTSGLFSSSGMARILDLIHEPPPDGINVFDFIQGKFGDLIVTRTSLGQYSLSSTRTISITGGPAEIKLFLDQTETSSDVLLGIRISEVAMIKYFPPGNARLPGIGSAGVLAVYTKKQDDLPAISNKAFAQRFVINGYSPVRDFSVYISTRKDAINLSTLYWDPDVVIDPSAKEYFFQLEKTVSAKKLHIIVEGFTIEGDIFYLDTIVNNN